MITVRGELNAMDSIIYTDQAGAIDMIERKPPIEALHA